MHYKEQLAIIKSLGITGETDTRMDCPFCYHPNSFIVKNENGKLSWYCFHASCNAKGAIQEEKTMNDIESLLKEKENLITQDKSLQNKSILEKLEAKKLDVLNNTMNMLLEFVSHLSKNRFADLRKEFISTIQKLSTKEDIINDISIDQKNKKLYFLDKTGDRLSIKDFSSGESELIAFSLIWAVNTSSNAFYPIITDSPFNRLDSEHRINFIDNIIKKANNQIIFLSTNEEISNLEQFGIKSYISKNYLIKYNKKTKTSSLNKTYFN